MKILINLLIIFLITFVISCTSEKSSQLINLDQAKKAVQNYYESGDYNHECSIIIENAISYISKINPTGKSAVVFDIDETALSNYEHSKKLGFGYVPKLYIEYLKTGSATAIKETKSFYDFLVSKKIHIIFLSGREEEYLSITKRNLLDQGYSTFDTLIIRQDNERTIPAAEYKTIKRKELTKNGYDIIACIGDQWSDLTGGDTGYKIKLPNYLYLIN
jgi:acid phosphatase